MIERQLEFIRKSWIKGVRKVVQAPEGSQIITVRSTGRAGAFGTLSPALRGVRDPKATPVLLTRDRQKASGVFIHEEVSEGIFDEINNVIDANRALAKGQRRFFLGQSIYYRIYAERQHVVQREDDISLLLHSAVCDLYAPYLFWISALPASAAETFAELYLHPKSPLIYSLIRFAALLGDEFCDWLYERWDRKWKRYSQPPSFYFSFKEMKSSITGNDPRLVAARVTSSTQFEVDQVSYEYVRIAGKSTTSSIAQASTACMRVFEGGDSSVRWTARNLDYFAYGLQVRDQASSITKAIIEAIGDQEAGDPTGAQDEG